MDFSKLSYSDLDEFLIIPYWDYNIQSNPNLSRIKQAELRFNSLKNIPDVVFPLSVRDLIIASNYSGSRDRFYTPGEIMNLTPEEIEAFDQIFNIEYLKHPLDTSRKRILRILRILGLIISPEQILLQSLILIHFCRKLSLEDLNNFRYAFDLNELPCYITVYDRDKQIKEISPLNDQSFQLIKNINQQGSKNTLVEASRGDKYEQVQYLLESQANPNSENIYRRLALPQASMLGHLDVVQLLLKHQADINLQTDYQRPALMHASEFGRSKIVQYLLESKANPNIKDAIGGTALTMASQSGYSQIVELLKSYNI